jgi:hypothetical protein
MCGVKLNWNVVNSVAEEEMSVNVSDADGEHSGDEEVMQVENSEKDGKETMDVTMTNVDLGADSKESMEVDSPNDQDPIRLMNDSDANKHNSSGEQMDVTEFTEEVGKPTKERTFDQSIRKPIETKSTQQAIKLQDVGDWTFWKVRPPPEHKRDAEECRRGNNSEDPATLGNVNRLIINNYNMRWQ